MRTQVRDGSPASPAGTRSRAGGGRRGPSLAGLWQRVAQPEPSARAILDDAATAQGENPVRPLCQGQIVCHEDERGVRLLDSVPRSSRRSRRRSAGPGSRSARRQRESWAGSKRHGPAPLAAARRPTAATGSDRAVRPGRRAPAGTRQSRGRSCPSPRSSSGTSTFSSAVSVGRRWKV